MTVCRAVAGRSGGGREGAGEIGGSSIRIVPQTAAAEWRREIGCDLAGGRLRRRRISACLPAGGAPVGRSTTTTGPWPADTRRARRRRIHRPPSRRAGRKRVFKKLNSDHSWHSDPRCRNRSSRTDTRTLAQIIHTHTGARVRNTRPRARARTYSILCACRLTFPRPRDTTTESVREQASPRLVVGFRRATLIICCVYPRTQTRHYQHVILTTRRDTILSTFSKLFK